MEDNLNEPGLDRPGEPESPESQQLNQIISIANQKGGVGKTTTAVNLATALAAIGRRMLLVDLDPQGNASTGLGVPKNMRSIGSYNVLLGDTPVPAATVKTAKLSVMPGSTALTV